MSCKLGLDLNATLYAAFLYTFLNFCETPGIQGREQSPDYACLSIGFLAETKLYPELPLHFNPIKCKNIEDNFLQYIDDGFILLLNSINMLVFQTILNDLHPSINFTFEKSRSIYTDKGTIMKKINFLDVSIILHDSGIIETDIYYKDTNNHDYLDFTSHHPDHIKKNGMQVSPCMAVTSHLLVVN